MEKIIMENKKSDEKNYISALNDSNFKKKNAKFLEDNFIKALKDPNFVEVVNNLDVKDEIKYRYTSQLKEIVTINNQCKNCQGYAFCPMDIPGVRKEVYAEDNVLKFCYRNCPLKDKIEKDNAYLNKVYRYKMAKDIVNASFKNIYKDDSKRLDVIKYLKSFYDNYLKSQPIKGLYLYGNFGCGKTYLISALFNELAKKDVSSTIIYFPEFLRSLKASFGMDDDEYNIRFDTVKESPLLLLDDIGAEKISDWARDEVLGVILQYRMEEHLPTFFTSNLSLEELEEHLMIYNTSSNKVKARRIMERIKYLTETKEMISVNRRV